MSGPGICRATSGRGAAWSSHCAPWSLRLFGLDRSASFRSIRKRIQNSNSAKTVNTIPKTRGANQLSMSLLHLGQKRPDRNAGPFPRAAMGQPARTGLCGGAGCEGRRVRVCQRMAGGATGSSPGGDGHPRHWRPDGATARPPPVSRLAATDIAAGSAMVS